MNYELKQVRICLKFNVKTSKLLTKKDEKQQIITKAIWLLSDATHQGSGLKVAHIFILIRVLRNPRYLVQKVSEEGSRRTLAKL